MVSRVRNHILHWMVDDKMLSSSSILSLVIGDWFIIIRCYVLPPVLDPLETLFLTQVLL